MYGKDRSLKIWRMIHPVTAGNQLPGIGIDLDLSIQGRSLSPDLAMPLYYFRFRLSLISLAHILLPFSSCTPTFVSQNNCAVTPN